MKSLLLLASASLALPQSAPQADAAATDPLLERVDEMLERAREEIRAYREEGGEDDGPDHPGRRWAAELWKLRDEHAGTAAAARATHEAIHLLLHAGRAQEAIDRVLALDAGDGAWPELIDVLWEAAELQEEYGFFVRKAPSVIAARDDPDERARMSFLLGQAYWVAGETRRAQELFADLSSGESDHAWRARAALHEIEQARHRDSAERQARDLWQRPARLMELLSVGPGSTVADVGSGKGYFTFRLADRVGPAGRALAVDIDEGVLEALRADAEQRGLDQVETVVGAADDPRLPADSLDALLVVDTYHEMTEHAAMMAGMFRALRPGGRLAIVDIPGELGLPRAEYHDSHDIPAELVIEEASAAGFRLRHYEHDFAREPAGRRFYVVVFEKPGP